MGKPLLEQLDLGRLLRDACRCHLTRDKRFRQLIEAWSGPSKNAFETRRRAGHRQGDRLVGFLRTALL